MISDEKFNELMNATEKQVKTFSFNGIEGYCKVSHVHDADTCRVIFYMNDKLTRVTVRLDEIDAPEIKPNKDQTQEEIENEKKAAEIARDRLIELTENKTIYMKLGKNDKYKRPLCNLYLCNSEKNICDRIQDILLKEYHVKKYSGGTKILYKDWENKACNF